MTCLEWISGKWLLIDSFMHINNFEPYSTLEENQIFLLILRTHIYFRYSDQFCRIRFITKLYMFHYYISYLVRMLFLNVYINALRGINKRKLGLDKFYAKMHSSIDLARVSLTSKGNRFQKSFNCVLTSCWVWNPNHSTS